MADDVFVWRMTAAPHASAIKSFREELIYAHAKQVPFPVSGLVDLLPIKVLQPDSLRARGDFEIVGNRFSNRSTEPLPVIVDDPAMGEYTISIPVVWSGNITVAGQEVTIQFDDGGLEVEIPSLRDLGVNRSEFQKFTQIKGDESYATSTFVDMVDQQKVTLIEVVVSNAAVPMSTYNDIAGSVVMFDSVSGSCMGDPNDPNWYVYVRTRDRICVVHYGQIIIGGQVAYDYLAGPGTKAEMDSIATQRCPDGWLP